jgi:hypothetical protein
VRHADDQLTYSGTSKELDNHLLLGLGLG